MDNATYLTDQADIGHTDLLGLYAYPADLAAPWIRVNFVSSIDGAVSVDGASGGLGTPSDKKVFGVLRELADVVLVGAGTVRAENYGGVRVDDATRRRRLVAGRAAVPPVAVVSASASIDASSRLFTDTEVPPLILTTSGAQAQRKDRLTAAGARVLELGTDSVPTDALLGALAAEGLARVLCEGGPGIFGQLIDDDAVDELCLTTSPVLVGGSSSRIAHSARGLRNAMTRGHMLIDGDGTVLTRWVRARQR
nr:pyrimidine reductase family protein [Spelaeibacter cavernicola]